MNTPGWNLLFIDDDEDDREIFRDVVAMLDQPVNFSSVDNGTDAFRFLKEQRVSLPHLVFMDVNMPGMNGKECLRLLKSDQDLKNIPVIMLSTSILPGDEKETTAVGASGFIEKPTDIREYKHILSAIVNGLPNGVEQVVKELKEREKQ